MMTFIRKIIFRLDFLNIPNLGALFALRLRGAFVGSGTKIYGKLILILHPLSKVMIGKNVVLNSAKGKYLLEMHSTNKIVTCKKTSYIEIGQNCCINATTISCRSTEIRIGKNTIIAAHCMITDSDFHNTLPIDKRWGEDAIEVKTDKPVIIEDYVWIGLGCIVLKGVTIGKGSVIGAHSVVTKNIPPMCLAAGNPAIPIKFFESN